MTFRTFFIVALLQFIAAFAVAVKILQEIFISNVNFLSEFDFSLAMPVLLSFALIALLLVRQWFSELRVMLACAAMLAFASLLCVGASSGSLFFWLLCLVANLCFCFMSAEIMIAGSLRPARIPVIIINAVAMALLFIDWRVFLVTRAHLNLKILTEVLQVRTLLLRSAFYMGVDGQQIVFDLVFL
ncbi:MAG: hypothetical protein EOM80_07925, partial [Erysipelotrichia bacterium]|nr:hypothetical protein [Erysipelotrichia bacterium]